MIKISRKSILVFHEQFNQLEAVNKSWLKINGLYAERKKIRGQRVRFLSQQIKRPKASNNEPNISVEHSQMEEYLRQILDGGEMIKQQIVIKTENLE